MKIVYLYTTLYILYIFIYNLIIYYDILKDIFLKKKSCSRCQEEMQKTATFQVHYTVQLHSSQIEKAI